MTNVLERDDWVEAVARTLMYDFLVRGLMYPTSAMWQATRDTILPGMAELQTTDSRLGGRLSEMVAVAAATTDFDDARRAHGLLFPPIESQDCPAYETAYRGTEVFQQAHIMADVAGFYRAHGVRPGGPERERPDHITTELTFMQFLSRKEAYALEHLGAERAAECRATQALFLRDHLGCWGPGMAKRMAAIASHPFFNALGLLLEAWLEHEMQALAVEPAELTVQPLPFPPPTSEGCGPDGHDCPAAGGCVC